MHTSIFFASCKKLCLLSTVLSLVTVFVLFHYFARRDLLGGERTLLKATRAFEDIEIRSTEPYGVKYINAQTYEGGIYGLGVAHARDRLWQMYFFRLLAQGRVSEVSNSP
jgi:penicillin G amidase